MVKRDTILFIGQKIKFDIHLLSALEKKLDQKLKGVLVVEKSNKSLLQRLKDSKLQTRFKKSNFEILILKNRQSHNLQSQLKPYSDRVLAMTVQRESLVPVYRKLLPHFPHIFGPTEKSLEWATNKLSMRHMLSTFDKKLCPRFALVTDFEVPTLRKTAKRIGFPLIAKPTGLASSLLVNQCYYEDELKKVLKKSFKKIKAVYKKNKGRDMPAMLVEQLMEGEVYTVDAYVNAKGRVVFCPLVYVETGRSAGFDDFFGYKQITPVKKLNKARQEEALAVAKKGIKALALRSVTCHIELVYNGNDWKIIEVAARLGGYRHDLYKESYGFNHGLNDLLNKLNIKPVVNKRVLGHGCLIKFYARQEGVIKRVRGIGAIKSIKSVIKYIPCLSKGDRAYFAKNGGSCVGLARLFNRNLASLKGDIRRVEQTIKIDIATKRQPYRQSGYKSA